MLVSNELRLGNYILVNKKIKRITLINNDLGFADVPLIGYQGKEADYINCDSGDVEPVPLTDEVLQQCQFVFNDYFHFWQRTTKNSGELSEMDIDLDYNLIDFMRRPIVKNLTSLHQLQNLYFALNGSELPFNELLKTTVIMRKD